MIYESTAVGGKLIARPDSGKIFIYNFFYSLLKERVSLVFETLSGLNIRIYTFIYFSALIPKKLS